MVRPSDRPPTTELFGETADAKPCKGHPSQGVQAAAEAAETHRSQSLGRDVAKPNRTKQDGWIGFLFRLRKRTTAMRSQTGKSPRTAFVYYYHIIIIISLAKDTITHTHTLCNFSQHVISIHKNSTSLLCLSQKWTNLSLFEIGTSSLR